jgi:RNA polymerase sigma factor (TIGR02999 family)
MLDDVSALLARVRAGDAEALAALLPPLYDELRAIAHRQRLRQREYDTLNTTALVHEAYARLSASRSLAPEDRAHLLALAARAMRDVLVDYARERRAEKRGGGVPALPLDMADVFGALPDAQVEEIVGVHESLRRLERVDPRAGQVVELRYFAGFSIPETAGLLGVSEATVRRDWAAARAWLFRDLGAAPTVWAASGAAPE